MLFRVPNISAELNSVIGENAPRRQFPAGKPRDAAIEARAASAVRDYFPGATVIRTALDDTDWTIKKNALGLPRYLTIQAARSTGAHKPASTPRHNESK